MGMAHLFKLLRKNTQIYSIPPLIFFFFIVFGYFQLCKPPAASSTLHHAQDKWYQFHKQHLCLLLLVQCVPEHKHSPNVHMSGNRKGMPVHKENTKVKKKHTHTPHTHRHTDTHTEAGGQVLINNVVSHVAFLCCGDHTFAARGCVIGAQHHDSYHCKKQYW